MFSLAQVRGEQKKPGPLLQFYLFTLWVVQVQVQVVEFMFLPGSAIAIGNIRGIKGSVKNTQYKKFGNVLKIEN